jgi:hypothetical protein
VIDALSWLCNWPWLDDGRVLRLGAPELVSATGHPVPLEIVASLLSTSTDAVRSILRRAVVDVARWREPTRLPRIEITPSRATPGVIDGVLA